MPFDVCVCVLQYIYIPVIPVWSTIFKEAEVIKYGVSQVEGIHKAAEENT